MVKYASVPDDKATPTYHHFEAPTAATNANTVANRAAPKTILYSCCGPARLSTNRSALCGLSRERVPYSAAFRRHPADGKLGVPCRKYTLSFSCRGVGSFQCYVRAAWRQRDMARE